MTDLDAIYEATKNLWEEFRAKRIFLTGGTGFFGTWLLETFAHANEKLHLDLQVTVLSRNPELFRASHPRLASNPMIRFHAGDVRDFDFPPGHFSHVIHAGTSTGTRHKPEDWLPTLDTITVGTRRTLEFAKACGARKFLFTSSGAVYGKQPPELTHVGESFPGGPDPLDPSSVYGEAKRLAELECVLYSSCFEPKIARCFALVGPHMPLDSVFAIGNFIRDGLAGKTIQISGDGTPYRSYLYASDLVVWLIKILCHGKPCTAYNVGSETAYSIAETAQAVAREFERRGTPIEIRIAGKPVPGRPAQRYIPLVTRAFTELGLKQTVELPEAIRRTVEWNLSQAHPRSDAKT